MYDYLFNRKQRVKVGGIYNSRREILYGVPQGWILGQLRFNIFLFDLCYFLEGANLISCADGNTPYNANLTPEIVIINSMKYVLFFSNGLTTTIRK